MKLVGMLDSPYVRRVAIALDLLGIPFEHQSLSVFRAFAEFQRINPAVEAPTLICDDGEILMDSTLILDHVEALGSPGRTLMPRDVPCCRRRPRPSTTTASPARWSGSSCGPCCRRRRRCRTRFDAGG